MGLGHRRGIGYSRCGVDPPYIEAHFIHSLDDLDLPPPWGPVALDSSGESTPYVELGEQVGLHLGPLFGQDAEHGAAADAPV